MSKNKEKQIYFGSKDELESIRYFEISNSIFFKKGPFGSSLKKSMFVPYNPSNTYKVYEQKNAIEKDINIGNYYINEEVYIKLKGFAVFPGDIIVSCAGTIGETYELPSTIHAGIINQALMIVRIDTNIYNKKVFLEIFNKEIIKTSLSKSNGSAIKNIPPLSDIKSIKYPNYTIERQNIIGNYLSQIDKLIKIKEKERDFFETIF